MRPRAGSERRREHRTIEVKCGADPTTNGFEAARDFTVAITHETPTQCSYNNQRQRQLLG
jgi:hypothetical protein